MAFTEEIGRHPYGERFVDDANPRLFQTRISSGRQWRLDPVSGLYKRNQTLANGVRHAVGEFHAVAPEFWRMMGTDGTGLGSKTISLERQNPAGNWLKENISGQTTPLPVGVTDDDGSWHWTGTSQRIAAYTARFDTVASSGKWSYDYQFSQSGTYRFTLSVRPERAVQQFTTHTAKILGAWNYPGAIRTDRQPCWARWVFVGDDNSLTFNWLDLWINGLVDPAETVVSQTEVKIVSPPFTVTEADVIASRVFTFDPTTSDEADWSAECENNGGNAWYPSDDEDWVGRAASTAQYRIAVKFNVGAVPATDTVSQVDVDMYVTNVDDDNGATHSWFPYGAGGVGDPSGDSAATGWSEIGSRTAYTTGITAYSTTGTQSVTLSGAANSDVEAIRDAAGSVYSICMTGSNEATTDLIIFHAQAATPANRRPDITVTHAAATARPILIGGKLINGGLLRRGLVG